jgi:hypothetical protein
MRSSCRFIAIGPMSTPGSVECPIFTARISAAMASAISS